MLWQFISILAVHWFGDFFLQSHWMGINKSKRFDALVAHVSIYTATLMLGGWAVLGSAQWVLHWAVLNGVLHLCTDFITSRITSRLYKAEQYHYFFVVIGLDQLIHQVTLAATLDFIPK